MNEKYQMIVDEIISHNPIFQNLISIEDIKEIDNMFINREPFAKYQNKNTNKKPIITKLIVSTITTLYTEEEIQQYFIDCIFHIQSNENTWVEISAGTLYKKIMDRKIQGIRENNANCFYELFIEVYKRNISSTKMYPLNFINKIMENINDRKSLKECYDIFEAKYKNNKHQSFASFINKYIISEIGEQKFCEYIYEITKEFYEKIKVITIQNINLDILRTYIFGYTWSFDYSQNSTTDNLNLLILKTIFPFIVHTYRNKDIRYKYYTLFNYDKNIIEQLEGKFNSFDTENYRLYPIAENYNKDDVLYYGISVENYFEMMKKQMDTILKTEREFPTYRNFMEQVNKKYGLPIFGRSCGLTSMQNTLLHNEYDKLAIAAKKKLFDNNKHEFPKNTWKIYYKKTDTYRSVVIDFTKIPSCKLRADLKQYVWEYINDEHTTASALTQVNTRMIRCFEYLTNEYGVRSIDEIEEWMILSFLNDLDVTHHQSPSSISNILSALRVMFVYFNLPNNPTDNITISHLSDHTRRTQVIPNDILLFLDNNISKLKQKDCGLIYRIASETGWRFSEIRNLTINDLSTIEGNTEFALISTKISKTKKARIKHRYGDIIEDNITIDLYKDIIQYIEDTKKSREIINTDLIFFRIVNGKSSFLQAAYYSNSLNRFLETNNVKSINETYTDFSAMQTRKTVASNLISNGASETDVQKKLGHISKGTTRTYYMEVERKKLSELNHEFYKEKFDLYVDEEKLKLFTEEERRILYIDFCVGKRQVELGECSKHPSEGRCVSLGYTSCAKCPKLCTGKKYLSRWEELLNDSNKILKMFIEEYVKHNIPEEEYSKYIEYRQEKELNDYYLVVVEKLRKEN